MGYDPYQFAAARAGVIGNTVSGIERAVVDTATQIAAISKQKGIDEKISGLHKEAVGRFKTELMEADPSISDQKATITAMRYIYSPIKGVSSEDNLKSLLSSSMAADKYLEDIRTKATAKTESEQMSQGAQTAVVGRRTPVTGFTEDAGPVMNQELPATDQGQALGRIGQMSADKEVPQRTADQWRQQPAVAALPEKAPEPVDPLQELKLEGEKLKNKLTEQQTKTSRALEKLRNRTPGDGSDNKKSLYVEASKMEREEKEYVDKLSKTKNNFIKAKKLISDNKFTLVEAAELNVPVTTSLEQIEQLITDVDSQYIDAQNDLVIAKERTKKALKMDDSPIANVTKEAQSDQLNKAYTAIKGRVAPGYTGTVDQLLSWLPEDLKSPLLSEIESARNKGASDSQIIKAIQYEAQRAR